MANEITLTINAQLVNGYLRDTFAPGAEQITQTTRGSHETVWVVGTSEEDLSIGDVATPGRVFLKNLDTTNYVDIGPKSGGSMVAAIRLSPGESHTFKSGPSVTWRAVANNAACRVLTKVWEL